MTHELHASAPGPAVSQIGRPRSGHGYGPPSRPVPGMTAVRRNPAVGTAYVRFHALSAGSPSAADTPVRWPGGQYLTDSVEKAGTPERLDTREPLVLATVEWRPWGGVSVRRGGRWRGDQLGDLPEVLDGRGQEEFVAGTIRAAQPQLVKAEDALQVREQDLDLLALPP